MLTALAHRFLVLACLSPFACAKKGEIEQRPPMGSEGAGCENGCNPGLACAPTSRVCAKLDHPELVAKRQADAERERAYLAQSGVQAPAHAEQPPPAPPPAPAPSAGVTGSAASGAVRVVRTSNGGKGAWVFAACRADERLVGGGCTPAKGKWTDVPEHMSGESATDTVGARWNCGWRETTFPSEIEAFALCQRL